MNFGRTLSHPASRWLSMVAILALFVLLPLGGSGGQQRLDNQCRNYPVMEKELRTRWGEKPAHHGITNSERTLIVHFLNKKTGTFTIIQVEAKTNMACIIASGKDWGFNPSFIGEDT